MPYNIFRISTSRDVDKQAIIVFVSPQIVLFHQVVHPLLDHRNVRLEVMFHRVNSRRLQLFVLQLLLPLHNPHDSSVESVLPITFDERLCAFRFLGLGG